MNVRPIMERKQKLYLVLMNEPMSHLGDLWNTTLILRIYHANIQLNGGMLPPFFYICKKIEYELGRDI